MVKTLIPVFLLNYIKGIVNTMRCRRFLRLFKREIAVVHKETGRAIILMATPIHGNLGDHAIVYAEKCLLADLGLGNRIIEITNTEYALCKQELRKYITNQDLILIDGGGNLGTLWPWEDDKISEIISFYRENPIVVFPQTCFYDDSLSAQERMKHNKEVYASAPHLLISLRDKRSYSLCCTHFDSKQFVLIPDIVLYLCGKNILPAPVNRKGILLCFRTDLERIVSQDELSRLKDYLKQHNLSFRENSTVKDYGVDRNFRQLELEKIWMDFASAQLVITDRLHGMIFALINGTPCLALDNVSKKVSGVYELISDINSVKICSDMNEVITNISGYCEIDYCPERTELVKANYCLLQNFIKDHILN